MTVIESALERTKRINSGSAAQGPSRNEPASVLAALRLTHDVVDLATEHLSRSGLHPSPQYAARLETEFRAIRREVLAARSRRLRSNRKVGPVLVVTSALAGEGKTFTALNLALCAARACVNDVLLIDGDTVRRTLSTAARVADRPGLLDLLRNPDGQFLDCVLPTTVGSLYLLPAGLAQSGADLFTAHRVSALFTLMRTALSDHFIVVDSPPLLASSDAPVLTDVAGQVLLVVRAGHTLQDSVREAVSLIQESVPIGVVLNGWSPLLSADRRAYTAVEDYGR